MKKHILFFFLTLSIAHFMNAQCPPGKDHHFSSQQLVDEFLSKYPNCTEIEGQVNVHATVSNLQGFRNVTRITGLLNIGSPDLNSLAGLENLVFLGKGIRLDSNKSLRDLSALQNLKSVNGNTLIITGNESLSNLDGLQNIAPATITGVEIHQNKSLSNCAIESICGYLRLPNHNATIWQNLGQCFDKQKALDACPPAVVPILVKSAIWGLGNQTADVTKKVQGFADSKQRFRAHISKQNLDSNPTNRTPKTLTIVYVENGKEITKAIQEGKYFQF